MPNPIVIGLGLLGIGLLGLVSGTKSASGASRVSTSTSLKNVTNARTKVNAGSSQDAAFLLRQARERWPERGITMGDLTAARLIASEHGSANPITAACIVDAEVNRAARKNRSLLSHLTGGTSIFGRQGRHDGVTRPAATRQNATLRHLEIAQAVLSGGARGISRGAQRFFDPKVQNGTNRKYRQAKARGETTRIIATCDGLGVLERWSYDLPRSSGGSACGSDSRPASSKRGNSPESWVGPIEGVDPFRLCLLKPATFGPEHDALYNQMKAIIIARS